MQLPPEENEVCSRPCSAFRVSVHRRLPAVDVCRSEAALRSGPVGTDIIMKCRQFSGLHTVCRVKLPHSTLRVVVELGFTLHLARMSKEAVQPYAACMWTSEVCRNLVRHLGLQRQRSRCSVKDLAEPQTLFALLSSSALQDSEKTNADDQLFKYGAIKN
eukprot:1167882-Amphidinium_carterae.1